MIEIVANNILHGGLYKKVPVFFCFFTRQLLFSPCSEVYEQLVSAGMIVPQPEKEPPTVPMDYKWAHELGLIRKPASFMTSICDERGEELLYAGMPISDVFKVSSGILSQ